MNWKGPLSNNIWWCNHVYKIRLIFCLSIVFSFSLNLYVLILSQQQLMSLLVFFFKHLFSYSDIIIEREVLMQKYIHLVQIVETEKVAANQLRTQLEDQDTEIERLKSEVRHTCDLYIYI